MIEKFRYRNDESTDTAYIDDTAEIIDSSADSAEEIADEVEIVDVIGAWPTSTPGTDISGELMSTYPSFEPSGLVEYGDSYLLVGDDGDVAKIGFDGNFEAYWNIGGDYEAITVGSSGLAYIADEDYSGILEFDPSSGSLTGESCTLDIPADVASNLGVEALTFVPAEYAPAAWGIDGEGFFIAGSQYVTDLYVYPAGSCVDGATNISHVATIPTTNTNLSGLNFNEDTQRLYALHDSAGTFDMLKLDGTLVNTYTLPTSTTSAQEEGIAVRAIDCDAGLGDLIIAVDKTTDESVAPGVIVDSAFPVTCK